MVNCTILTKGQSYKKAISPNSSPLSFSDATQRSRYQSKWANSNSNSKSNRRRKKGHYLSTCDEHRPEILLHDNTHLFPSGTLETGEEGDKRHGIQGAADGLIEHKLDDRVAHVELGLHDAVVPLRAIEDFLIVGRRRIDGGAAGREVFAREAVFEQLLPASFLVAVSWSGLRGRRLCSVLGLGWMGNVAVPEIIRWATHGREEDEL
jgi:hypothetical protein